MDKRKVILCRVKRHDERVTLVSNRTVWSSKVTPAMVKGWSDDAVAELVQELDDAVVRTIDDIASQFGEELAS
jgi:hypothetical protein